MLEAQRLCMRRLLIERVSTGPQGRLLTREVALPASPRVIVLDEEVDEPDVEQLYRQHSDWLRRRVSRQFGPEDAEDLVQEAYVRTADHRRSLSHPRGFLLTVAFNLGRDLARRRKTALCAVAAAPESGPATGMNVSSGGQIETILLKQIILALPEADRRVFLMSRFEGLSNSAIARALGISVKTVEWRMSRALARCAAHLRDEG